jgi:hypothetical protein
MTGASGAGRVATARGEQHRDRPVQRGLEPLAFQPILVAWPAVDADDRVEGIDV